MIHTLPFWGQQRAVVITLARFRALGILAFLALFVLAASFQAPNFLTISNLENITVDISLLTIVAVGEALVIIARQIDLSVGSILGVCGIAVGFFLKAHPGFPVPLALLMGLGLGVLLGVGNGFVVTVIRVPAIITTLGTLSIYRGLAYIVSGAHQVNPEDLPQGLINLAQTSPLRIPWLVIIALSIALVAGICLQLTRPGRELYAVGSNPTAASFRGLRVGVVVFSTLVICGALSGLAGVLYAGRYATVNPDAGVGFELQVIAAVVVGGVNIFGGSGSILGAVLGCLLLGTISNVLALLNLSEYWQEAIQGGIILAAVTVDTELRLRLQQALRGGGR
jgi:rhamnose transport system permease protein